MLAIDENQSLLPGVSGPGRAGALLPLRRDDGQYPRLRQPDHRAGVRAGQGRKCGAGVACYRTGSLIGQAGVEASFEKYLRGTPGVEKVQVDSQGHVLDSY